MSGGKAQKQQESALLTSANQGIQKADTIDPALQKMRDYWMAVKDWATGASGPVDVTKMPGSGVELDLAQRARAVKDKGRIGTGIATLADGANPNFTATLDKEMEFERNLDAATGLEGAVENKVNNADTALTGIGNQQSQQNLNVAQLRSGLYRDYLNRPKTPNPWLQLALGALSGGSQIAAGAASFGGLAALH